MSWYSYIWIGFAFGLLLYLIMAYYRSAKTRRNAALDNELRNQQYYIYTIQATQNQQQNRVLNDQPPKYDDVINHPQIYPQNIKY